MGSCVGHVNGRAGLKLPVGFSGDALAQQLRISAIHIHGELPDIVSTVCEIHGGREPGTWPGHLLH